MWEARDLDLGRAVALKVLHLGMGEVGRGRFAREARALARIRHESVVQVYDSGESEGHPYLVMEFIPGENLRQRALRLDPAVRPEDGPARRRLAVRALLQVGEGLSEVHRAGLLHRDLKPENVMQTPGGRAVLVDFGLALTPDSTRVTETGSVAATLIYAAPERLAGREAVAASDWFSFAVTLYAVLEGRLPWSVSEIARSTRGGNRPPVRFDELGPGDPLRQVLEANLVLRPEDRPDPAWTLEQLAREAGSGSQAPVTLSIPLAAPSRWRPDPSPEPGPEPATGKVTRPGRVLGTVALCLAAGAAWFSSGGPPGRGSPAARVPVAAGAARDAGSGPEEPRRGSPGNPDADRALLALETLERSARAPRSPARRPFRADRGERVRLWLEEETIGDRARLLEAALIWIAALDREPGGWEVPGRDLASRHRWLPLLVLAETEREVVERYLAEAPLRLAIEDRVEGDLGSPEEFAALEARVEALAMDRAGLPGIAPWPGPGPEPAARLCLRGASGLPAPEGLTGLVLALATAAREAPQVWQHGIFLAALGRIPAALAERAGGCGALVPALEALLAAFPPNRADAGPADAWYLAVPAGLVRRTVEVVTDCGLEWDEARRTRIRERIEALEAEGTRGTGWLALHASGTRARLAHPGFWLAKPAALVRLLERFAAMG